MPASGTFSEEMDPLIDFNELGAIIPKSITLRPRQGNASPRVCETPSGMINSIGIQSKGIRFYLEKTIPYYEKYKVPLISSISGDSIDEFVQLAEILEPIEGIAGLELNISCPNLQGNGLAFGMDPEVTYQLVHKVKEVTDKPVIAKLTPNVTSIQDVALAAEKGGADCLNVANTILAMAIDVHRCKPKIGNIMGGLSGPAIKPIIVRMIYQVHQVSDLPIIGCGGVMNGEDAIELILAGATAVQVGTASFIHPTAMTDILQDIRNYMIRHNVHDIKDLIGQVDVS